MAAPEAPSHTGLTRQAITALAQAWRERADDETETLVKVALLRCADEIEMLADGVLAIFGGRRRSG